VPDAAAPVTDAASNVAKAVVVRNARFMNGVPWDDEWRVMRTARAGFWKAHPAIA
jgi:hypothetical protein